MQTRKNVNLAPESFRRSAVPRRLKHRARRRRRILCLLPVILVFGVLAAALLRFTPALAYADIFPAQATTRRIKDVPYISQLPTLPTGCESAGAAMLLNYYGCTVTAEEFASYYLPTGDAPHTDENGELIGCDPWEAFPGDPFSETGWGCYSTVIERAMNEFLTNTGYHAERLSHETELKQKLARLAEIDNQIAQSEKEKSEDTAKGVIKDEQEKKFSVEDYCRKYATGEITPEYEAESSM